MKEINQLKDKNKDKNKNKNKDKMKSKFKINLSKFMVALLLLSSASGFTSTLSSAEDNSLVFEKTYTKDGKFYMPITYNGYSGSEATISATLENEAGEIVETFKTLKANPGMGITYSKVFTKMSGGTYYLNVVCEFLFYDPVVYTLKINHKSNSVKMALTSSYQIFTDAGDAKQVFKLDYFNAIKKKLNVQVYDQYGTLLYTSSMVAKYVNGNCTFYWDYYPSGGGLRVTDDIYIVKYWVDGQTPKQESFEVYLGEG